MTRASRRPIYRDRQTVEFWSRVPGCRIALVEGIYRFERDATPGDPRQPAPTPIPEDLARAAIAAGVPARRDGDLFRSAV